MNLLDKNIEWILCSAFEYGKDLNANEEKYSRLEDFLLGEDYNIIPLNSRSNEWNEKHVIAYCENNQYFIKDRIKVILKKFGGYVAFKPKGTEEIFKATNNKKCIISNPKFNGLERIFNIGHNFFILEEQANYKIIESKTELKTGMIVEYMNGEQWVKKKVNDIDKEFDNIYKLFMKYNKLRYEI